MAVRGSRHLASDNHGTSHGLARILYILMSVVQASAGLLLSTAYAGAMKDSLTMIIVPKLPKISNVLRLRPCDAELSTLAPKVRILQELIIHGFIFGKYHQCCDHIILQSLATPTSRIPSTMELRTPCLHDMAVTFSSSSSSSFPSSIRAVADCSFAHSCWAYENAIAADGSELCTGPGRS